MEISSSSWSSLWGKGQSVPNILKVLNPLFLDDLRETLEGVGDNARKLLNLRKRISKIRVFDPACGSGNFLVIAYKQLREIENQISERREERGRKSEIPLTNFRGIEIRGFSAEIARLALIIAEYQCDVEYLGQREALIEFLPLSSENWITCGNALRLDWLSICPPTGTDVNHVAKDLFEETDQKYEVDFENEGGETYICGNPPYLGSRNQTEDQKSDLQLVCGSLIKNWKSLDYVAAWFLKSVEFGASVDVSVAFVSTNSICQGLQVSTLWPAILNGGFEISFAHNSFKWRNLASHNAGVTVVIIGISNCPPRERLLFNLLSQDKVEERRVPNINAYLMPGPDLSVEKRSKPISKLTPMTFGNTPIDGGNLLMTRDELGGLSLQESLRSKLIRRIYGSAEFIRGIERYCLWIEDEYLEQALEVKPIRTRIETVRELRNAGGKTARDIASKSHQFQRMLSAEKHTLVVPRVSSESRDYLPVGILESRCIVSDSAFAAFDAPAWCISLLASKLHLAWIATVCGKLKTDYRYSNTLGWNTFPVPTLTDKNKEDLTRCAENILIARETHSPATIADLYAPEKMPGNLRQAHEENDEVLERIYIGRRFRNDTECLEKLFEMYTKMTANQVA